MNFHPGVYLSVCHSCVRERNENDPWSETVVREGAYIWLPSPEVALMLTEHVQSGSISFDIINTTLKFLNVIKEIAIATSNVFVGICAGFMDANSFGLNHEALYDGLASRAAYPYLFKIGFAAGAAAAATLGIVEVLAGLGAEVGGVALDLTGVGAIVGVPVNIAAAAVIAHGSAVALSGLAVVGVTIGDLISEMSSYNGSQKGKTFRGGSQTSRDQWYGYNDKQFQRWWHRKGKVEFGGEDIMNKEQAREIYDYWVSLGKPTVK